MDLFKNEIIEMLMDSQVGNKFIENVFIEEIETINGNIERFINNENETNNWDTLTTIIIKKTDSFNTIYKKLINDSRNILFWKEIPYDPTIKLKENILISQMDSKTNISKAICKVKLAYIY